MTPGLEKTLERPTIHYQFSEAYIVGETKMVSTNDIQGFFKAATLAEVEGNYSQPKTTFRKVCGVSKTYKSNLEKVGNEL